MSDVQQQQQQVKSALKRSQKTTDFAISRERSFVRPNGRDAQQKRKSQTFVAVNRAKPTMEIYRPPNVRMDIPQGKLNVHAKEFTMNDIQPSRSGGKSGGFFFIAKMMRKMCGLHGKTCPEALLLFVTTCSHKRIW